MVEKNRYIVQPLAVAPLIIDSPFGDTDEGNSRVSAEVISADFDQVILLVSSKQYDEEVRNTLRNKVGKSYYFDYFTKADSGDGKKSSSYVWFKNGKKGDAVHYGQDKEATVITPLPEK